MAKSTLKITKKYIINEGTPDEQCYDLINQYNIGDTLPPVYIVCKNEKYGIINDVGEVITPLIYDGISYCKDRRPKSIYRNFFYAKKDDKTGIITNDNQIIFPFIYDGLSVDQCLIEAMNLVSFYDAISKKRGLAKWPSGELVYPAQWDVIEPVITFNRHFFLCGELSPNSIRALPNYRWNIIGDGGKKLFDSCRYIHFLPDYYSYGDGYEYNIAVTEIETYYSGVDFVDVFNCSIEVFYRDGTIVYSGKCSGVKRLEYTNNVFVIGKYGSDNEYSLHIHYQDKNGNHQLYRQDFQCKNSEDYTKAVYLVEHSPKLQKMIKPR